MRQSAKSIIKRLLLVLKPKHKEGFHIRGTCDLIMIDRITKQVTLIDWKYK